MRKSHIKFKDDSPRGLFACELYNQMKKNKDIWLVTGDLGYHVLDFIKRDFPDRFINAGASEQAMIGIAVGLALEKKIPFVYSITSFLIFRPFETIRNYLHHEKIPVRLVGVARDKDYIEEGISHWAEEDRQVMSIFSNIQARWTKKKQDIPQLVEKMVAINSPWYINLAREKGDTVKSIRKKNNDDENT